MAEQKMLRRPLVQGVTNSSADKIQATNLGGWVETKLSGRLGRCLPQLKVGGSYSPPSAYCQLFCFLKLLAVWSFL